MKPLVSVIVPNFNHLDFLKDRIDSILNQTYRHIEVILLDDASSDGSQEMIRNYGNDQRIKHRIINERNSGSPFKQWQKGIRIAKGELIWIAESDDVAELNFLEKLVPVFRDDSIVISYCQSFDIDNLGNIVGTRKDYTDSIDENHWNSSYVNDGFNEIENYLVKRNTIPNASAVVFRNKQLHMIPEDAFNYKMTGDWLIWICFLRNGKISFLNEPLNYFRLSPNNTREHNTLDKRLTRIIEGLEILNYMNSFVSQNSISEKRNEYLKQWSRINKSKFWRSSFYDLSRQSRVVSTNQVLYYGIRGTFREIYKYLYWDIYRYHIKKDYTPSES